MGVPSAFCFLPSAFCLLLLLRALLAEDERPRRLDGVEDLLIQLEGDLGVQRSGGAPTDDLRDLRRVMRRGRQTLAGSLNLTKARDQLFAQRFPKKSCDDVALEILVVDVHGL